MMTEKELTEFGTKIAMKLSNVGVPLGDVVEYKWDSKIKTKWGQCHRVWTSTNYTYTITLSDQLAEFKEPLECTLVHELLHTIDGCFNHGTKWKNMARLINQKFGYEVAREKSFPEIDKNDQAKYVFICEGCGQKVLRYRKCDFVTNNKAYSCGICHSKFKRIK